MTDSLRCESLHDGSNVKLSYVVMPAFNTPQFSWVKSRLARRPQPVPPIFQPEVGAEAIYYVAHHNRRELYVGRSALKAVIGNMIALALLDGYLARTGYSAQQYDGAVEPNRRDNLWKPVPGDRGARGAFSDRSATRLPGFWATVHQTELTAVPCGLAGIGAAICKVKR